MDNSKSAAAEPSQGLEEAFAQLGTNRLEALRDLRDMQLLNHVLFQHEAGRLKAKLGSSHPRVQQLEAQLQHNLRLVHDLEVELEAAAIIVPQVSPGDALFQGRVWDVKHRGLAGLTVFLADANGKGISALGSDETAVSGYYTLPISAESLERYAGTVVFMTVCTKTGQIVYRDATPLELKPDAIVIVEATLNRDDLTPVGGKPPINDDGDQEPDDALGPNVWAVKGRVTDPEKQGMSALLVSLFDKDLLFDDRLGTVLTDEKGYFKIIYMTADFRDLFDAKPDLFLKVMDREGNTLYTSRKSVLYKAGRIEVINVTLK